VITIKFDEPVLGQSMKTGEHTADPPLPFPPVTREEKLRLRLLANNMRSVADSMLKHLNENK
jgi:hypothetical protein